MRRKRSLKGSLSGLMTLILKQSSLFANDGQINGSSIRSHDYHSLAAIMKKFLFANDGRLMGRLLGLMTLIL